MAVKTILKTSKSLCSLQGLHGQTAIRSFTTQLTEPQQKFQELCRNFSNEHLKPVAAKLDREGLFPDEQIKKATELGLMGISVSKKDGGLGLDYLSVALAVEELSRGCASTGMIVALHNLLYCNLVSEKGTPEQKEEFLKGYTCGCIGCFALSEHDAGSDVANISTTARRDGDHWILDGRKSWVSSAIEGKATVIFATVDPQLRHKGIACFLIPLETDGVFRGKKQQTMGVRALTACEIRLEGVRVPKRYMVGEVGEGFKIAMQQLDQARIGVSAQAVGIAQSALDTAINFAKERVVFGKNLTQLPSVQDRLTEMSILIESARLLTYRAATEVSTKNSAMAKYVAGRNAAAAASHAVQVLGGRGIATSFSAERHYRDARGTQIYGGVTDIQKQLIGHFLLKQHDAL